MRQRVVTPKDGAVLMYQCVVGHLGLVPGTSESGGVSAVLRGDRTWIWKLSGRIEASLLLTMEALDNFWYSVTSMSLDSDARELACALIAVLLLCWHLAL